MYSQHITDWNLEDDHDILYQESIWKILHNTIGIVKSEKNQVSCKYLWIHDSVKQRRLHPEVGYNIRKTQERLGHKNVSTTMIYTHIIDTGGHGVRSPVDGL